MKEVEAKAHVGFMIMLGLIQKLNQDYGECTDASKIDYYYKKDNKQFRIREQNNKFFYNEKQEKKLDNGFECNTEVEKEISEKEKEKITKGLKPFFSKVKNGWMWKTKFMDYDANIEFFDVVNLGQFLEIEVLVSDDNTDNIEKAKNWITEIFKKYELDKNIEPKKYMEMLNG